MKTLTKREKAYLLFVMEHGYYDPAEAGVAPLGDAELSKEVADLSSESSNLHFSSWNRAYRKLTALECLRGLMASDAPKVLRAVAVYRDDLPAILAELSL